MGHGVVVRDVRYRSFEIAWQRKWEHTYTCWQVPLPLLINQLQRTCRLIIMGFSRHALMRNKTSRTRNTGEYRQYSSFPYSQHWRVPTVFLTILTSTDGSIASKSRIGGCYVSYGIIITIVTYPYQYYLYLVLENNVLHEKRKKTVFLRILYVHTEYKVPSGTYRGGSGARTDWKTCSMMRLVSYAYDIVLRRYDISVL